MSITSINYILPSTESFVAKLIHHEERAKSSPDNFPNFTNPLVPNTEEINYTFAFKEAISQPYRMDFVEAMRK